MIFKIELRLFMCACIVYLSHDEVKQVQIKLLVNCFNTLCMQIFVSLNFVYFVLGYLKKSRITTRSQRNDVCLFIFRHKSWFKIIIIIIMLLSLLFSSKMTAMVFLWNQSLAFSWGVYYNYEAAFSEVSRISCTADDTCSFCAARFLTRGSWLSYLQSSRHLVVQVSLRNW